LSGKCDSHSASTNPNPSLSFTHGGKIKVLGTTNSDSGDSVTEQSGTGAGSSGKDTTHITGSDETDYHIGSVYPGESRVLDLTNPVKPSFPNTNTHRAKPQDRPEPQFKVGYQYRTLVRQLEQMEVRKGYSV